VPARKPHARQPLTVLQQLHADYVAGHYAGVETEAEALVGRQGDADAGKRREAAQAGLLFAYAAARQRHFEVAGERFILTRNIAASLPDHGARPVPFGDPEPGIEEEAAFQGVVCVSAEGHKAEAEAGYRDFMRDYPQSILIHAAVKRIARFHKGDIPKEAEAVWRQAMRLQAQQERTRRREQALCGPECLAELLHRQGKASDVHALAREMHTDETGTSLAALSETAKRHGFVAQGVELTQAGLMQQKLPAVAYLRSGHYVLVDRVEPAAVTVWDPDAHGAGKGADQALLLKQWQQHWSGIALVK
jgi:predicted double-glycine peptidase